MITNFPTYILHYNNNFDRKTVLDTILLKEGFENCHWITEYDKETVSYDCYVNNFQADILTYLQRKQTFNHGYLQITKYQLASWELSLCLKHKRSLEKFLETNADACLVLEDDAIIQQDFKKQFQSLFMQLPANWDVAFIGTGCNQHIPSNEIQSNIYWYLKQDTKCTDSIVWSKKGAVNVLNAINKHKICMTIDHELAFWIQTLDLKCFWLEPPLVVQGSQTGVFPSMQTGAGSYTNTSMPIRQDINEILLSLNIQKSHGL